MAKSGLIDLGCRTSPPVVLGLLGGNRMRRSRPTKGVERESAAIPYMECLTKTNLAPGESRLPGRTVFNHFQNSTGAGCSHFAAWGRICCRLSRYWQGKPDLPGKNSTWNGWLSALESHPELQGVNPGLEKQWGGHAGVSQVAANARWLCRYSLCGLSRNGAQLDTVSPFCFFGAELRDYSLSGVDAS